MKKRLILLLLIILLMTTLIACRKNKSASEMSATPELLASVSPTPRAEPTAAVSPVPDEKATSSALPMPSEKPTTTAIPAQSQKPVTAPAATQKPTASQGLPSLQTYTDSGEFIEESEADEASRPAAATLRPSPANTPVQTQEALIVEPLFSSPAMPKPSVSPAVTAVPAATFVTAMPTVPTATPSPTPTPHIHVPVADAAIEATCQRSGLTAGSHCSVCGEILTPRQMIPLQEHLYFDGFCIWCGESAPGAGSYGDAAVLLPEIY